MGKVGGSLKLKTPSKSKTEKVSTDARSKSSISATSNATKPARMIVPQKTPAQLAFEAAQQKRQQQKLPLLAAKSHKEKVAEFNEYLGKLSEHHDIPKVGPG